MKSESQVANRYASAFLKDSRSKDPGVLDVVESLHAAISSQPAITVLLAERKIPSDLKLNAVKASLGSVPAVFQIFLDIVAKNNRLPYLEAITKAILEIARNQAGIREAQVIAARPLSESQLALVSMQMKAKTGFTYKLTQKSDPSLIGGFLVQASDTVYDFTIKARLTELHGRLTGASTRG